MYIIIGFHEAYRTIVLCQLLRPEMRQKPEYLFGTDMFKFISTGLVYSVHITKI
jgi:hypothetical protein